ncbi:fumarylacetoacetate hydrolase family protein [Arthrobacter sp. MA-N2]|uniref:fumarylacetoacetate hydrolase family protein n=1 Tax=Arthrobacter sp. MA-N2 TaxID=1101188 RepID=UPI0006869608|nr:fumarylacetoacetate hydrolase family protein [Arthrobacter sp. MA-N2]
MKIANYGGRLALTDGKSVMDVEARSNGRFASDPGAIYGEWDEFSLWAQTVTKDAAEELDKSKLWAPSPRPSQIFAVGLNYKDHAEEIKAPLPDFPQVFTKFPSSLAGTTTRVMLPEEGNCDWEAELVVVVGSGGRDIPVDEALNRVAGFCVGQDLSDRRLQTHGAAPQFSLGKSFEGFAPTGPWLVGTSDFDVNGASVECRLNGEVVQQSTLANMVFSVPELISKISSVAELRPGDLIFTGTPAGIGAVRNPQRFLSEGDTLTTTISGIGSIVQDFVRDKFAEHVLDRATR